MSEAIENVGAKAKRKQAGKAAGRQAAVKVKATIHLSVEADQRLNIHCAMLGIDRSTMVEKLINENLRRFVVSDRGGVADEGAGEAA